MKIVQFNPRDIMVPEVRVTSRFDDETLAQFRQSIAADGSAVSIMCIMVDGKPWLVDGKHRLDEALANKWPLIDVALVEGTIVDVFTLNLKLDHLRGKHPVSEMIQVIKLLSEEFKLDSPAIAEKTGLSRDYVERLQALSKLTPMCLAYLDEGRIKVGHAAALTRITDAARQEAVLMQLDMYHWTVKVLDEYITDVLNIIQTQQQQPPAGPPKPPPTVKCFYCQDSYDVTEIANPNTCRHCSLIMLEAIAEARRAIAAEAKAAVKPPEAVAPPGGSTDATHSKV